MVQPGVSRTKRSGDVAWLGRTLEACDHGAGQVLVGLEAREDHAADMENDQDKRQIGGAFVEFLDPLGAGVLRAL